MSVITTKAIRIDEVGPPEVMKYVDVTLGDPGPGEVLVQQKACGLNYIDIYFRSGYYPQPLPGGIGMEASGIVEKVGDGVQHVKAGDRVAYAGRPTGAYAQARIMLQGLTVQYLLNDTYKVQKGDTVLFHAIAGGVGLIALQWLKAIGANVIGTVGSEEKAALAKSFGCDHVILYREEDFVKRVKEITNGKGVPVAYDAVGKDTFMKTLDCVSPRGMAVTFGNASGSIPPLDLSLLSSKGSLKVTRPTLMTYALNRSLLEPMSVDLFDRVMKGQIKIEIKQKYALADAVQAHRDLEGRKTTGTTILIP